MVSANAIGDELTTAHMSPSLLPLSAVRGSLLAGQGPVVVVVVVNIVYLTLLTCFSPVKGGYYETRKIKCEEFSQSKTQP